MNGKAVVFTSVGRAVLEELAVGAPGPDEVLVENEYTVVSPGTERANLMGLPNTVVSEKGFPFHPGYSGAGRVLSAGRDVDGLAPGDRVVIPWGGHRTHTVKKASSVLKIEDDGIDLLDAAFAHIASFSFLGVRKLKIELGEAAMIVGAGILGAFAVQVAALSGAIPVLVADLDPRRRELALKLGATHAFSPDAPDFVAQVKQATGERGPEAVVEVTGSALALRQALEYVAWEGRISLLGCTRVSDVPIDFYQHVHRRGVSLIGAHTFTRAQQESAPHRWTEHDDYRTFLKLVAAGRLQTRPLISAIASPADAPQVYARLAESKNPPPGIVFDWKAEKHVHAC
jgi:2-desacetyl-2-hydroxyethyl bacteriochlorophyllide A dehydrogenase